MRQPVNPLAIVPESSARMASGTISSRRSGTRLETPAIMMPTEPKIRCARLDFQTHSDCLTVSFFAGAVLCESQSQLSSLLPLVCSR